MSEQNKNSHYILQNGLLANEKYIAKNRWNPESSKEEEEPKDYTFQTAQLSGFLNSFLTSRVARRERRTIKLPDHIDYVEILFFRPFDEALESFFVSKYGLAPTKFYFFNKRVLFAITDEDLFQEFIKQIRAFIDEQEGAFDNRLKLIKEFHFFSSGKIKEGFEKELTYIELISEGLTRDGK